MVISFRSVRFIFLIGLLCSTQGVFAQPQSEAIDSLERVLLITADHTQKVRILLELSDITAEEYPETALEYANRAGTIARNVENKEGQINAYIKLAFIYRTMEEYGNAITNMDQAVAIQKDIGDPSGLAYSMNEMGRLYRQQGDFANAMKSYVEALDQAREAKSTRMQGISFGNIGSLHFSEEGVFEALEAFNQAIRIYEDAGTDPDFAPFYSEMGKVYKIQGNNPKAIEYFMTAVKLHERVGQERSLAETHFVVGNTYEVMDNYEMAQVHYLTSLDYANRTLYQEYSIDGNKKVAEIYAILGDYEKAYEFQRVYSGIKGSRDAAELDANLTAAADKLKLEQLEKETALNEADLRNRNIIMWGLGGVVVLISVFLIFILRQMRLKNATNEALQVAKDRSERSQEEKEKFLAYTSHEIRTPLNAVLGMTEMLRKTRLTQEQARYVNTVKSSSDNILVIVNDILDMTKIDSGKIEFESIDFIMTELIDEIIYMLQPKADAKGVKLFATYDQKLPRVVKGDPLRLSQIMLNLVNNAIKFTKQGEVRIGLHVLSESDAEAKIGFTVADTGIGIKKDKLSTVFNRFEQEDRDTTRKYGGAGLGLSITKQLVELQGGSISVRSKYGEGSIFSVRISYLKSTEENLKNQANPDTPKPEGLYSRLRILIVDDNNLNRLILHDLLMDWSSDLRIEMAEDGQEGLRKLRSMAFDVVLMDIQMPVMNGYKAAEQIRENFPEPLCHIPIIAMTAHALSGIADKCKEAGMDDYVSKPIDLAELIQKISKLVGSQPVSQELTEHYQMFDPVHLQDLSKNNPDKIARYIDIFLKNLSTDLQELKKCFEQEDWDALAKRAHKMKGNCAYIGIQELVDIFSEIQEYGEMEVEYEDVRSMVERAERISDKAAAELRSYRSQIKTSTVTEP